MLSVLNVLASTPQMTAIEWPIDPLSIVSVIGAAGATVVLAVLGLKVGFKLIDKLGNKSMRGI